MVLFELALFLKKLVLLEFTCKFIDLLAKHHLLGIALVIERFLMRKKLLLEFLLTDGLYARLSLKAFLNLNIFFFLLLLFGFEFKLVLTVQGLKFLLLS